MTYAVAAGWLVEGFATAVGVVLVTGFAVLLMCFLFGARPRGE